MAALPCDLCGEEQAISMTTDLRNGDSIAVGEQCLVTYALTMAATVTEGMPPEFAEQYSALFASIASHGPQPAPSSVSPAATRARGKRHASPAGDATGAAFSTESAATSDDSEQGDSGVNLAVPPGGDHEHAATAADAS